MSGRYTIKFETSYHDGGRVGVLVLVLGVYCDETRIFRFDVAVTHHVQLLAEDKGLTNADLLGVMLEAGLDDLERGLAAGIYPPDGADRLEVMFTSDSDDRLWAYEDREKHCRWQTRTEIGWSCEATPDLDHDRRTTAVLCAGCVMPDERVICPHLVHPSIHLVRSEEGVYSRVPYAAPFCQIGNDPGVGKECYLGGKDCAVRIVETRRSLDPPDDVARRAADEIDYFALVYRDRYEGSRVWSIPQARTISEFFGTCEDAEDFQRRVAALADLLSRLSPYHQLEEEKRKDATGNQVGPLIALERVMERDHPEAVAAVRLLRRIPDARNSFPIHTRNEKLLDAMRDLGVDFPAVDWNLAWLQVLTAFWSSVRDIRVALQTAARSE
jgi:hypothetical protein